MRLHMSLSMPDGPADPLVDLAALSMLVSSMLSNITGSTLGSLVVVNVCSVSQVGGVLSGCLSFSLEMVSGVISWMPVRVDDTHFIAAPTFPSNINFTKTFWWCTG
jgi:hypothetical protein